MYVIEPDFFMYGKQSCLSVLAQTTHHHQGLDCSTVKDRDGTKPVFVSIEFAPTLSEGMIILYSNVLVIMQYIRTP